ncbi:MAG: PrgI family protein [Patescibacteria group bacterium]|nr:PrgI family protein [Patescibacteria group bacterium]
MRFTVPQFIEHEAKIVGPLTFKQFTYIGIAGAICFILYFSVSFPLFLLASVVLVGGGMALAFLKIGGRSLPGVIGSFLRFKLTPKMYLWKRKQGTISILKQKKAEKKEEETSLKIVKKSQLKNIQTEIETKTK